MKKYIQKIAFAALPLLSLAAAVAISQPLQAKPASKAPFVVTQPDGTQLTLHKVGDEFGHLILTDDGVAVRKSGDAYYYLQLDDNGEPMTSELLAAPESLRTPEQLAFLNTPAVKGVAAKMQAKMSATRMQRTATRNTVTRATTPRRGPGLTQSAFPYMGVNKCVVVLVEYPDKKFKTENIREYIDNMLNQDGFSASGGDSSVRQYFVGNSKGQFEPQFDVYGPVTLSHNMSYYGGNDFYGNDRNPEAMVTEACTLLDSEVDFSQYDNDGDHVIDNVCVFYAGYGEADYDDPDTVWPHSWDLSSSTRPTVVVDGCVPDHYICSSELNGATSLPDGIGTFVHEFSHAIGLPDLYCTQEVSAKNEPFTPGAFSVLDYGPYNNKGNTPPNYSTFERYALGWIDPIEFTESDYCELENLYDSNKAYIAHTDSKREFFLFENRQRVGNDRFIPCGGMLVWHVDALQNVFDNNTVNNSKDHQYVDLVEADGVMTSSSRNGDAFPGILFVNEFTETTYPAFKSWSGKGCGFGLYNIWEEDGKISFVLAKDGDDPSAVELLPASDASAPFLDGLTLRVPSGSAEVFDISGLRIADVTESFTLPAPGIYIVRAAGKTYKIAAH